MNDIEKRLVKCFVAVFPDLSENQATTASQESVDVWDSMATVTLITVVDDEFRIELDIEQLAEMTSFQRIYQLLTATIQHG